MSKRTIALIAVAVLARAVSAEASHVIPTGLVIADGFPVQVDLKFSAYDPPPNGPFHLVISSFSWTATASGGVVIDSWTPGPTNVPIPYSNLGLSWGFESSATGLGGLGAVVTGNKGDPYNYGAGADPSYTPIILLGSFMISAIGPGEIIFDGIYTSPIITPPGLIHETVIQVIPEPSTALMFAAGLVAFTVHRRRNRDRHR